MGLVGVARFSQALHRCLLFPKAPRAKGSRLVVWGSGGRGRGRPWHDACVSAPVQRGVRLFEEIVFPCSVGRCCLVMRRCGARSRVTFSNTWGATVFVVNRVVALALCFSMIRGRPWLYVPSLEVLFFRFGAQTLYFSIRVRFGETHLGAPCGTVNIQKTFPCSAALIFFQK